MDIRIDPVAGDADAALWLELRNRIAGRPYSASERARLREMAPDTIELLARLNGEAVGAGVVGPSINEPRGAHANAGAFVIPEARGRGVGQALYEEISRRAAALGKQELETTVPADNEATLAFLRGRGFREVTRVQEATLDVEHAAPAEPLPNGLEVVTLAERPDLERGAYEVAREAVPDIPVAEPHDPGREEDWRREELVHAVPELSLVAVTAGEVVGYTLLGDYGDGRALHLMTGVRRAWRGRGVARALKVATIEAARRAGVRSLVAFNDATNAPMQRLNVALGYRLHPVYATYRGPLAG